MKRQAKFFILLVCSLFLITTAIDSALDHLSRSPGQSTFLVYDQEGEVLLAYAGDLAECKAFSKPVPSVAPILLHRT